MHAGIESVCETLTNGIGPVSSYHRRHGQTLYEGVTDDPELLSFSFSTCGNSACCGIDLTIGEEYLIGLYGEGADLVAESCGLFREWESVTDAELAELEGCSEESDLCDGSCGEFEVFMRACMFVGVDPPHRRACFCHVLVSSCFIGCCCKKHTPEFCGAVPKPKTKASRARHTSTSNK